MLCKRHGTEQRGVANAQDTVTVMRVILDVLIHLNGEKEDVEKDLTHGNHIMQLVKKQVDLTLFQIVRYFVGLVMNRLSNLPSLCVGVKL